MLDKMITGAIVGGVVGVIAMFGSIFKGDPLGESLGMVPFSAAIGAAIVWWWFNREGSDGHYDPSEQQISRLQNKLRSTVKSATLYEGRGDLLGAAHFRAEAAAIESQLRNLGA
ncbi:hypothetical protein ASD67_10755 [Sphingopyxis sp. Root1497]|uniref:hypothetical protein n=1 Tax=Sphingopyxis sp. Root1497 TaxID=1736474 RepID=UPI0006F2CC08|nr:hypothetical protein [Sphingopyxis sp. Root1497]KQZ64886.1 hypothetical protein ASD67_10755 [Sphingopyxis sp. Root1497]